jgi:DNA gyrase subunit A
METPNNQGTIADSRIRPVLIEDELKSSFLDYAMSVVVSRALPDVRDGLKPVHRRILYAMHTQGYHYNKSYHKSVRVVGEVLGKYHPHGDQAVYNTMVGLVQEFSKRYPLLDGQGNWGSVDGDNAAAMRYTEVRMKRISDEILADLDKETVNFVPNFDESTTEPVILPSKIPNLLINGASGIAVGMATSIPPHNLGEVIDGCLALLANRNMTDEELFALIPGPDFPTGGIICGRGGIIKAYQTGRGSLIVRGVVDVEETKKGSAIIVSELPYQVNKAELIIKIAELVKEKVVEGITNIRDESNKKGTRLVIDIKRGEDPQVVLNQLYKYTDLETSIHILMLGLLDNRPMVFGIRELIQEFLAHREEVIYKRSLYDFNRAKQREHILQGLLIALREIDEVIALIKKSKAADEAIEQLNKRFLLTEDQSKAILEMRLQRLTGLEQEKIKLEMEEITKHLAYLKSILDDRVKLYQEIVTELEYIKNEYADKRRTRIEGSAEILTQADLIPDEEVVVTLTRKGYIKRVPLAVYQVQHRGGKGKMGISDLESVDDFIENFYVTRNHDMLLFFTSLGRVYSLNVYEIPEASRTARGRAIVNLLPLTDGERVVKLLFTRHMENKFIVMVTKQGTIKRTDAMDFARIRATGIRAVTLNDKDELAYCAMSSGKDSIVLATAKGQGIRFEEGEVRAMGRQAAGVIGIRMRAGDYVVGMEVIDDGRDILFATQFGYGKRTRIADFRVAHRGGYGVRTIPTTKRNGLVIGLAQVSDDSNILLIDTVGKIIRLPSQEIRTMGRQAAGVRLIKLDEGQTLAAMVAFEEHAHDSDHHELSGVEKPVATQMKADSEGPVEQISLFGQSYDDGSLEQPKLYLSPERTEQD